MIRITIGREPLTLGELRSAWQDPVQVTLGDGAKERIKASVAKVAEIIEGGDQVYGVNTGFGLLANVRISEDELERLQLNLIRSHATGLGDPLPDSTVRLIMLMKLRALAEGHSGVRLALAEMLVRMLNEGIYPIIPKKGSVGASGDLAPLAHMSLPLIGEGEVRVNGERVAAADALAASGIEPIRPAPKEGLALLNGTQVSAAIALAAVFRTENLLSAALAAGAMSTDAIKGSDAPFDARIHDIRRQKGQQDIATMLRSLMSGSEIRASHVDCDRVQDPYSIRCQPQVNGACLDVLRHTASVLEIEASAVTDNPLVLDDGIFSGGNFHAEPVAFAADHLALAITEITSLCERRIALLVDPHMSGLPAFLVENSGLNSGFMMVQIVAAALTSELKALAHPHSVDSIPTSANQEDHVSMATGAANRLHDMLENASKVVAIELLAAAQGIDFHHPQQSSDALETCHRQLRELSPKYEDDRSLEDDVNRVADLIESGWFYAHCVAVMPSG